jgi:hypothetical protein
VRGLKAIRKIADKHNLFVIEDNAQAIGAHGDGFKIGELSNAVCTSFITQRIWVPSATVDKNPKALSIEQIRDYKMDHRQLGVAV